MRRNPAAHATGAGADSEAGPLDVSVFMPLYVRDWLTGTATFTMTNRQRGAFLQLLAHAWTQEASLPDFLPALAKYADEPVEWFDSAEGAALLALWPVDPADGRRRNPKQTDVYRDSVARREKAHRAGVAGASARWANRGLGDTPLVEPHGTADTSPAPPAFADAINQYPDVIAFAAQSPDYTAALTRALWRVYNGLSAESIPGFVALVNNALNGMDGPQITPKQVASALADWCDNHGNLTKHGLRFHLNGAATKSAGRGATNRVRNINAAAGAAKAQGWEPA